MKTNKGYNRPTEKGQSLVELAISLTFILILLAGAVYFGIGLFYYIAMRDAAQEGALYGSMNPPDDSGDCPPNPRPNPEDPNPSPQPSDLEKLCSRIKYASGDGLVQELYDANPENVSVQITGASCEGSGITVTFVHEYPISKLFAAGAFIEPFVGSDHITLRAVVTDTILSPVCP